jgi:acetolactate synthase-1/2/3 large subunit
LLATADAVLVVDSDVPWFPSVSNPPSEGKVIQMGIDPVYSNYPIRSFPCDVSVRADSSVAIPMLAAALAAYRGAAQARIAARYERLTALHDQQRSAWQEALENVRDDSPLDPQWITHCINEIKDDDTIIVNEYDLVPTQATFNQPGTLFGNSPAGGLGWGLGAALGAKLAAPDKLVIATLGDGSYMFGNPTPCHFVSQALGVPTLTVVYNNRVWNAVRRANLGMYPNGWAAKTNHFPLSELQPSPQFEVLVTASGGYGERVERAADVRPALQRALKAVREEGRQAVLNMICKHP